MSISYFTIGLKIWCPTDMGVHLFCQHLVYFFGFFHLFGPAKPLEVNSGKLHSVRVHTWCSVAHFAQQIWLKYTWNFTSTDLKCIDIKACAKSSWKSYRPIPAEQQLNKLLPATTQIWDFLPVMWFHKGITQAGSKTSRQPPCQKWAPSHAPLKYSLNKTIPIVTFLPMGGQEIMS